MITEIDLSPARVRVQGDEGATYMPLVSWQPSRGIESHASHLDATGHAIPVVEQEPEAPDQPAANSPREPEGRAP